MSSFVTFLKFVFENYSMMFYRIKVCLKTQNIFNIFKYVLKIIFMSNALFLITLYICIIIF